MMTDAELMSTIYDEHPFFHGEKYFEWCRNRTLIKLIPVTEEYGNYSYYLNFKDLHNRLMEFNDWYPVLDIQIDMFEKTIKVKRFNTRENKEVEISYQYKIETTFKGTRANAK